MCEIHRRRPRWKNVSFICREWSPTIAEIWDASGKWKRCRFSRFVPGRLGWTGANLWNRERFYFPDASQFSAMVGDHSRQMKTQIFIVGGVGDGFRSIPIPQIAELQSPRHASFNFWRTFHFRLNSSGITERIVVIIRYIWDGRQKVKAAIVWDFPDIWEPGLRKKIKWRSSALNRVN